MLSTLSCYQSREKKYVSPIDIEQVIQWDKVYRLSPGPPWVQLQNCAVEPIKQILKEDYQNLPLNYSSSIDEMKDSDTDFVSSQLVKKINNLFMGLNEPHKIAVDLLFNFYERNSITFPVFWARKLITNSDLHYHSFCFSDNGESIDTVTGEVMDQELFKFYEDRLNYLTRLLSVENYFQS